MTTLVQIAWVAGLLEGEGYLAFQTSPKIDVSMVDRDVVTKLRNILNENVSVVPRNYGGGLGQRQQYRIQVCGNRAVQWMMTIYPLMSERRKAKIREILNRWKASKKAK